MLDVRSLGDDIEVAEKCLQNRVVTVPGVAFGDGSERIPADLVLQYRRANGRRRAADEGSFVE